MITCYTVAKNKKFNPNLFVVSFVELEHRDAIKINDEISMSSFIKLLQAMMSEGYSLLLCKNILNMTSLNLINWGSQFSLDDKNNLIYINLAFKNKLSERLGNSRPVTFAAFKCL